MASSGNRVDLAVRDLERSRSFYEPVMRYLGYGMARAGGDEIVFSQIDSATAAALKVRSVAAGQARATLRDASGARDALAFDAASRDDVDGLYIALREISARILRPPSNHRDSDTYAMVFTDPDGTIVEFAHTPSSQPAAPAADTLVIRSLTREAEECAATGCC